MDKILLQHACGYGLKWYEATSARHDEYAKINGYERVLSGTNKTGYLPHWERYRVCLEIWEKNPKALILWVDADCCIVTNEDVAASIPDSVDLMLLQCKQSFIWRSGVFVARGTDAVKTIFTKVLKDGPVRPKEAPWDDEDRLNRTMTGAGFHPYPLQACWNEIVRHTPENYPSFGPEVKIAALHGMTDLIKLAYVMSWAKGWTKYDPKVARDGTPDERDLCWYIRSHESNLADQCLCYLRGPYPNSDVQLVDDGTKDPALGYIADRYNAKLFSEPHDYKAETAGIMWQKNLKRYLENSAAKWLIKIDTDTIILRKLERKLSDTCLSGALFLPTGQQMLIHGGFVAIPRAAAEKTFAVGNLLSDIYNNAGLQRIDEFGRKMPSEDKVISMAMVENGIKLVNYTEVGNAVIHPVKRII